MLGHAWPLHATVHARGARPHRTHLVVTPQIHLGVDTTGTKIKLETGAVNEASFRCPDEDGWQPQGERIVSENELTHKYTTDFPIAVLAGEDCGGFVAVCGGGLGGGGEEETGTGAGGCGACGREVRAGLHVCFGADEMDGCSRAVPGPPTA